MGRIAKFVTLDQLGAVTDRLSSTEQAGAALTTRLTSAESKITGNTNRLDALELWRGSKAAAFTTNMVADLKTNYNVVTTILGDLVGAMNTTNAKVNGVITEQNTMKAIMKTREIVA